MTRLHLTPDTDLLIAERSLGVPAVALGMAAGLHLFFWLRARRGTHGAAALAVLFVGAIAIGLLGVGGLIWVAGRMHPGFGWACAAVALVGVVAASYVQGTRGAAGRGAVLLLVLRLLAIAVLVVLYFEPTLKRVNRQVRRSKLLVLVDTSGSMRIKDGPNGLSRLGWVKSELLGRRGALAKLREVFELECYAFADTLELLDPDRPGEALAALEPRGAATAFAPTVGEACARADKLRTKGVLVFTDGIDNSGRDPVERIARSRLPVFPVAVGSKLREKGDFKDIAVARVDYERYMAADNRSEITAHIEAVGLRGRRVAVRLVFDGKERDSRPLVLDDFPGTQTVRLAVTPSRKGTFRCSVEVAPDPEERIADNNKKEFDVVVTEPAIKVLLVEGVLRPEYKFLLRTLQMDPNVQLLALVQVRKGHFLQQGNVEGIRLSGFPKEYETLKKFHVVIFGDIHRSLFTTAQLGNVQKFVEAGGGFLMLGGDSTLGPGGYAGTPVGEVLPVELIGLDAGQEKDRFRLRLTADGVAHPVFSGITPFFGTARAPAERPLPALSGCTRVGPLKPGAVALAVHPTRTGRDGKPLVIAAVQRYGRGRTMVFAGINTRHWYFKLRGLGRDTPYVRFWGQTVRWLAGKEVKEMEEKPGVTAYTDRRYYEPGSTVRIYARVRNDEGQATNQALVTAVINQPDGTEARRQIPYIPGSTGKYEVDFDPPLPGRYTMLVRAEVLDQPVGEAVELEFRVGRPNLEFDRLDLDDAMLQRLADRTRGKYIPLLGLDRFLAKLKSDEQARSTITSIDLWSDQSVTVFGQRVSPYLLIAFLVFTGLVTAEWILRKRRELV